MFVKNEKAFPYNIGIRTVTNQVSKIMEHFCFYVGISSILF